MIIICAASICCSIGCAGLSLDQGEGKVFVYSGDAGTVKNKVMDQGAVYTTYQVKWVDGVWHKQVVRTFPGKADFRGEFMDD